jgi:hypothetical protein
MYTTYVGRNGNQLYRKVLADILLDGTFVAPRGKRTQEIQAITQITHPMERVLTVPGRGANPFFNVAENLAILGAIEDQRSWLGQFNKNYLQFFDNETDRATHAFYGTRLRQYGDEYVTDQLQEITKKLQADPSTRQAVATLWDPYLDNDPGHKDYPCNFALKFSIRELKLNMTVINRSNDVHWGLFGVNFSQFSFIQEILAAILGVAVGEQIHISDSLHLYLDEPHKSITERMAQYKTGFDIYEHTKPVPMFIGKSTWKDIDEGVSQFFASWSTSRDFSKYIGNFTFLDDAWFFLRAYMDKRDGGQKLLRFVGDNALWVAGMEYLLRVRPEKTDVHLFENETSERFSNSTSVEAVIKYALSANILQSV